MKATTSKRPGLSMKDQPLERVTNINAWLMVLIWRYRAEDSFSFIGVEIEGFDILNLC